MSIRSEPTPAGFIRFTVVSSVDSQNGFGALVRSRFACIAKFDSRHWELLDLSIV